MSALETQAPTTIREDPETELLLLCARTHREPDVQARMQALLDEAVDWERMVRLARRHRVTPLLYRSVRGELAEAVPEEIRQGLRQYQKRRAVRNLLQTKTLLQIVEQLRTHNIAVLPFKGPMLSALVYEDHVLREFGDLDILVRRLDVPRTCALLEEAGYHPHGEEGKAPDEITARLERGKSYEFVGNSVVVELHWEFLHPMHGFYLDPDAIWERVEQVTLSGTDVYTLSPDDLLLYLCAHGSKHFWRQVTLICDVAECLRVYQDEIDWSFVLSQAEALHAERMLFLGLHLAADLLGASLPNHVAQQVRQSQAVQQMARSVQDWLFRENGMSERELTWEQATFHLKMRERFTDRLPYYMQLARLAVQPNEKDKAFMALPEELSFLYYLVRPVRLLQSGWNGKG